MVFTTDFKQRVYDALQFNPYLLACMEALEDNSSIRFRIALDMAMDDIKEAIKPRILLDDGDRQLWNGIVTQYNNVNKIYAEFMENFLKEMDSVKTKV